MARSAWAAQAASRSTWASRQLVFEINPAGGGAGAVFKLLAIGGPALDEKGATFDLQAFDAPILFAGLTLFVAKICTLFAAPGPPAIEH